MELIELKNGKNKSNVIISVDIFWIIISFVSNAAEKQQMHILYSLV
jgi:hypothetical protein